MATDINKTVERLRGCPCGRKHEIAIKNITVESGASARCAEILKASDIGNKLRLVADKNTLNAAGGIVNILRDRGFTVDITLFDDMQRADIVHINRIISESGACDAYFAVGTGTINDICRYAAYKTGKQLVLFATAPSMDGFASTMAPIIENGFKRTYPAVGPDVIIADTKILAAAPAELKAAGLGDLLGKYTALCDWEIATLTTGEYYCENIARMTKEAVDLAVSLAPGITGGSEQSAAALMDALVLSGLSMLMSGSTRPASGSEHHLAHFWEMQYMLRGLPQVFHGKKVGIACAMIADVYKKMSEIPDITAHPSKIDAELLKTVYGGLADECLKENTPDPLAQIDPRRLEAWWPQIRQILAKVPSGDEIRRLLALAGGAPDYRSAGIPADLALNGIRYGYLSRFRVTMMRLASMLDGIGEVYRLEP